MRLGGRYRRRGRAQVHFTGDTLCDAGCPWCSRSIRFPEPVIYVAIEPRTAADEQKLTER
jgi:translation elongation factor EF-G